jgi:hypothetical protein
MINRWLPKNRPVAPILTTSPGEEMHKTCAEKDRQANPKTFGYAGTEPSNTVL